MLDLRHVLSNIDEVAARLASRGDGVPANALDRLRSLDEERRSAIAEVETLKKRRNETSPKIGAMLKRGENADALRAEVRQLGERISTFDERIGAIEQELGEALLDLPNLPHDSCPVGPDESANRVERTWGERPEFSFGPRDHVAIGELNGILDLERAAKVTGARFAVLTGRGARLARALTNFMLDLHTAEHGYEEVQPPFVANRDSLVATGQLPKFEQDLFRLADHDGWYLVPTAEVPLTNLHRDEILDESALPIRYTAYTPCFRSEAGSHGRDVRGLIRQHQFDKVELVAFASPDASWEILESLTAHAEEVLRRLGLHYRVVTLSTGDLGFASAKTYDIEVWLPSQGRFREISSCSNYADYQARRGSIRFRPAEGGKPRFVHTLNGSGLAVGRTMVALMEQRQRENGEFDVPAVLEPYMGSRLG